MSEKVYQTKYWCETSWHIWQSFDCDGFWLKLLPEIAAKLGCRTSDLDVFIEVNCGSTYAARADWDDYHGCIAGWLTEKPAELKKVGEFEL
jgi:hypothetical protein